MRPRGGVSGQSVGRGLRRVRRPGFHVSRSRRCFLASPERPGAVSRPSSAHVFRSLPQRPSYWGEAASRVLCLVLCSLHADLEIYISKRSEKNQKSRFMTHDNYSRPSPPARGHWFQAPCRRSGRPVRCGGGACSLLCGLRVPRHLWVAVMAATAEVLAGGGHPASWAEPWLETLQCRLGRGGPRVWCASAATWTFPPFSTPCWLSLQMWSPQMWRGGRPCMTFTFRGSGITTSWHTGMTFHVRTDRGCFRGVVASGAAGAEAAWPATPGTFRPWPSAGATAGPALR